MRSRAKLVDSPFALLDTLSTRAHSGSIVAPSSALLDDTHAMFTMSIASTAQHVQVTAAGPAGLPELSGLAAFIAECVKNQSQSRVLVDLSAAELALSFTDHVRFGAVLWELLGGFEKVALVVPRGYQDAGAARAAKLAGLALRTFAESAVARAWLAEADPSARREPAPALGHAAPSW